jgi:hypothetical protein
MLRTMSLAWYVMVFWPPPGIAVSWPGMVRVRPSASYVYPLVFTRSAVSNVHVVPPDAVVVWQEPFVAGP